MTVAFLKKVYDPKCKRCPLHKYATHVCVPSSGRVSQYKALVVGEAPGRNEDEQNVPFVGQSGWLLNRALRKAFIAENAREEIIVTNAVKCRPRNNGTPTLSAIDTCVSAFLTREILILDPFVILAVGNVAAQALLNETGVGRLRGTWHRLDSEAERYVRVTWHPSYVQRKGLGSKEAIEFYDDVDTFAARAIAHG